ncbi:hypothetical protein Bca101_014291 [Brassica carinata]
MASSSSFYSPPNWRYSVFASFHGPDVRKTFLSHLRKQFICSGITMFDDQGIERSQTIAPALTQAIRESRIWIVILSKKYASSSWCLRELVEILECKEATGQIVMTIFYGVDPSDVRQQTGDFGSSFDATCARTTEEERKRWSQALNHVGNIAGEHFLNWDNESEMIEKIARDVSNKLNATTCKDFEDIVGIETHLLRLQSLLCLDYEDGAMIVGICGPAGIGKTTIARALYSQLANSFQLTCFMENLSENYNNGLDEYGFKLCLQEKLLSKVLNQNGMMICHLGSIHERLQDQKVLIILDDVEDLKQLEALANDINWFGHGSRIIITTKDQELLEQHGINITYHVDFPTKEEAREIFCKYSFRQSSAPDGFKELAKRVTKLCSNLPLGLRVMGSSLRGKDENEWEVILDRLENSLERDIEGVLRVGYDNLHENDQSLFLLIAFFFNYTSDAHVMAMLADSNLDTSGSKTRALERKILIDAHEICDVLETDSGGRSVMGISFDVSKILDNVFISERTFKRMHNLQFLRVYKKRFDRNDIVHVPEDMNLPPRLRLLHWEVYPRKSLPRTFNPQYLVELDLQNSQLVMLWEGIQPLTNLKKMDLSGSKNLEQLPDLSYATNLERLLLSTCESLVEIPSSIGNLHKLKRLRMVFCIKLQVVPSHFNLASLERVNMMGCSQLRKFPDISINITSLSISDAMLEELPKSISLWSRLQTLSIFGSVSTSPYVTRRSLNRSGSDIEKLPDCIKDLHGLEDLYIGGCPKLASLPALPGSLRTLVADTCESLETLPFSFASPILFLYFPNCFKLGQEARRAITQESDSMMACLPGRKIPVEFDHRAVGNSLSIRSDFNRFMVSVVVYPKHNIQGCVHLTCHIRINGYPIDENIALHLFNIQTEHLFITQPNLLEAYGWLEQNNEILFEFSTTSQVIDIIECGVRILRDVVEDSGDRRNRYGLKQFSEEGDDLSYEYEPNKMLKDTDKASNEEEENNVEGKEHAYCWSWFVYCFDFSRICVRKMGRLGWETRQYDQMIWM